MNSLWMIYDVGGGGSAGTAAADGEDEDAGSAGVDVLLMMISEYFYRSYPSPFVDMLMCVYFNTHAY